MIKIMSHSQALREVKSHSKEYHVIFITSPADPFYRPEMHDLVTHSKSCLVCKFNDSEFKEREGSPGRKDIEDILEFAKDKDNIIVTCHAGVSRSSATAFILHCRNQEPQEAVKNLNPDKHTPNNLIIEYGASILDKPEMVQVVNKFKYDRDSVYYRKL